MVQSGLINAHHDASRQPTVTIVPPARKRKLGQADLDEIPDDDAPDEELAFLTSLARSVDDNAVPAERSRFTAPQIGAPALREEVDLSLFRDTLIDREARVRPNVTVPDVAIDDLMEDLTTMRAALRARKAA